MNLQVKAQLKGCTNFKNGKFKMVHKGHTIFVERNGNIQHEEAVDLRKTTSFKVAWVDDCHYTLTPVPDTFKDNLKAPSGLVISVSIDRVTDSSYFQTSTANYSNVVVKGEMVRLKK